MEFKIGKIFLTALRLTFVVERRHVDAKSHNHLSKLQGRDHIGNPGGYFVSDRL